MKRAAWIGLFSAAIGATAIGAVGCTPDPITKTVTVKGTAVDHGEALFSDPTASPSSLNSFSCATCHLAAPDAGDTRILPGAPLAGAAVRPTFWAGQENDLLRSINDCRFHFMDAQEPWAADDPEAQAMWAWLTSIEDKGPTSASAFTVVKSVKDLPAGDASKGETVYTRACRSCHGDVHTAAGRLTERAPILPDDTLVEHAEFSAVDQRVIFVEKIRHGSFLGYSGNMPPFSKEVLSDADVGALLQYLGMYK